MRRAICSIGLLLLVLPSIAPAQAQAPTRVVTVTAGVGNAMGWYGLQGERYFGPDRASAFVGLGYNLGVGDDESTGATFAAGLRGYTGGFSHRGFLEASVSQIFVQSGGGSDRRLYGPGLAAGYQYAARGGFTFMISLGLAYAPGKDDGGSKVGGLANLGLGYTWRRK